uniref:DUF4705 domain-containing protein n=1 Tax=Piliocolobus tephrosceles TaxID=591936 RepID=A0A8C9GXN9_9PRIM
ISPLTTAFPGPVCALLATSPGPEAPQDGLSQSDCSLLESSPALLPGCVYRPNSCLTATSLDSAPAQLLVDFVGPQLPQAKLFRPSSGLTVASPGGLAPALQRSLQACKLPPGGSSRPSLGVPATSAGPHIVLKSATPGPVPGSQRPLQAQHGTSTHASIAAFPGLAFPSSHLLVDPWVHNFLPSASPGPAPHEELDLQLASLGSVSCLQKAYIQAQPLLTVDSPTPSFDRPGSCLSKATSGPAHPSQWPFWAQFVPFWRPLQAQLFLPAAASSGEADLRSFWAWRGHQKGTNLLAGRNLAL